MFRAIKSLWLVPVLMLSGGYSVFGFALGGPIGNASDSFQTQTLGYNLGPPNFSTDNVAPKDIAEGYRWNTRNVYYSFDATFLGWFGTNGAAQIDAAFAILNSLSNVDAYTPTLSEWPLQSGRVNFTANSTRLLDVKSFVLVDMMEQLGLAEPDRYAYCLHDRISTGPCPNFTYNVIMRNYDPVTQNYSAYVNGVLYTFNIIETCADNPNPFIPLISDAATTLVDPDQASESMSPVAGGILNGFTSVFGGIGPTLPGRYFVGFTRDDVGGFRYLWSTNTIYTEAADPTALLQLPSPPSIVLTSNLSQLQSDALTNGPAALQALYPTLQITGTNPPSFGFVPVTNFVVVTNPPPVGSVAGTPPTIVTNPVVTSVSVQLFSYTFGNVITNFTYTNGGVLVTNAPNEYLLVPSNTCGFSILSNALTMTITSTNANGFVSSFTSHALVVDVFSCIPNAVALREGIEKVNFIRVDYDSLTGTNWPGVTNTYTLTAISNSHPVTQTFYRVVTQPDILFHAGDLPGTTAATRTPPNFNQSTIPSADQAGPGTISRPVEIILSKVGPIFTVSNPSFLVTLSPFGNTNLPQFQWASFDGSTNAPFVYPQNNNYSNLVSSIFLQITTPGSLPTGFVNTSYNQLLSASGATPPPYFFAVSSGSLPPGLGLVTAGGNTSISGTPTATGVFDFVLSVTDTSTPPRTTYSNFSLEVDNP